MLITDNPLGRAIAKADKALAELPAEKLAKLDKTLAVDFEEHFAYQTLQAQSHASGLLTTDEAQLIYVALGEVGSPSNGGWATGTDTATKYVITLLIEKLLAARLGR